MRYSSERNVIKELQSYSKSQFKEEQKEIDKDGSIFYQYSFVRNGYDGWITAIYDLNKQIYKSIDMDCNFRRPAGYNNYSDLKYVMDHIRSLFE